MPDRNAADPGLDGQVQRAPTPPFSAAAVDDATSANCQRRAPSGWCLRRSRDARIPIRVARPMLDAARATRQMALGPANPSAPGEPVGRRLQSFYTQNGRLMVPRARHRMPDRSGNGRVHRPDRRRDRRLQANQETTRAAKSGSSAGVVRTSAGRRHHCAGPSGASFVAAADPRPLAEDVRRSQTRTNLRPGGGKRAPGRISRPPSAIAGRSGQILVGTHQDRRISGARARLAEAKAKSHPADHQQARRR